MRSVVSFGNPADPCGRSRGFASPPCGGFAFVVETGLQFRLAPILQSPVVLSALREVT